MRILTDECKEIVEAEYFAIQKNVGKKDKKFGIVAYSKTVAQVNLSGSVVCACFPDEEGAKRELEKVADFFNENPFKVYKFSNR